MRLYDLNTEKEYSIPELFAEWKEFRNEDPFNHADSFTAEFYEILLAAVNGRNDMDIIGYTGKEISNIILRIGGKVK